MSILIKGIKMPSNCYDCQFLEGDRFDGLCHAANKWLDDDFFRWYQYDEGDVDDNKPLNCPLIEVPPHGRLIDADALINRLAPNQAYFRYAIREEIKNLTTIIEAEEGEHGEEKR